MTDWYQAAEHLRAQIDYRIQQAQGKPVRVAWLTDNDTTITPTPLLGTSPLDDPSGCWYANSGRVFYPWDTRTTIEVIWDPRQVLSEAEADLDLLRLHQPQRVEHDQDGIEHNLPPEDWWCDHCREDWPCPTLRLLARRYVDPAQQPDGNPCGGSGEEGEEMNGPTEAEGEPPWAERDGAADALRGVLPIVEAQARARVAEEIAQAIENDPTDTGLDISALPSLDEQRRRHVAIARLYATSPQATPGCPPSTEPAPETPREGPSAQKGSFPYTDDQPVV